MSEKRKYPSTALSTAQRELIARLVGPLEARGISRSVFRDILADAEITVPKSSWDRWVRAHAVTGWDLHGGEGQRSGAPAGRRAVRDCGRLGSVAERLEPGRLADLVLNVLRLGLGGRAGSDDGA
jgi:hypothetical protein